jgi:endoglucanase
MIDVLEKKLYFKVHHLRKGSPSMKLLWISKKQLFTPFIIILMSTIGISQQKIQNPAGFEIRRGVNLSHWLSQNFGWSPKATFITEKDIRFIDSIGYDHVRIPIDEAELWDKNGRPSDESFTYLTHCLDWCSKYKLRAIIDLHILKAHHFNAANEGGKNTLWTDSTAQENFIKLWNDISIRLKNYPVSMVAYEIMNEPVADDHDDWNKLIAKAVKALRKLEPDRVLIIGSNKWQIPDTFPSLHVPENDKNIILSTHTYAPLAFTHYLADWVAAKEYKGPVHYPGQIISDADYKKYVDTNNSALVQSLALTQGIYDRKRLAEILMPAIQKARDLNLQLYCGEFGCLPHVDRAERLKYYSDIISTFEENNIAWCNWEYKGDFGIYTFDFVSKESLAPDTGLIKILMQGKK